MQTKKIQSSLPKIWLMRQAGRYLPEYQEIRKTTGSFLNLCYNPKLASKVTMQPIERFNMDAAIVFSDILVTADILGIKVDFQENIGPILEKITTQEEINKLKPKKNSKQSENVAQTIKFCKQQLLEKPIIGFVGGAWTIAAYIIEGKGKNNFKEAVKKIYTEKKMVLSLIDKIVQQNIYYLIDQINAGCQIIQIFESHAGIVPNQYFDELIIKPTNLICKEIKKNFPEVKIIGFPRESGFLYEKFIEQTSIDIISCDQHIPIEKMLEWQKIKVVQGNLDPLILFSNINVIKNTVDDIMSKLDSNKLIFNLGHGILPETPVENVKFLVEYVKSWQ